MEIRLTAGGRDPLSTKVVFCDEPGFEVASVIVIGNNDAVLLDATSCSIRLIPSPARSRPKSAGSGEE